MRGQMGFIADLRGQLLQKPLQIPLQEDDQTMKHSDEHLNTVNGGSKLILGSFLRKARN